MNKKITTYTGKAGQLAVMGEFLLRGWNVAIPEVDVGDDIFVVQDDKGLLKRVQVKSALGNQTRNGYSAQFHIPSSQINRLNLIEQYFVFAVRIERLWVDFIVMPGDVVQGIFKEKPSSKAFKMHLVFSQNEVFCGKVNLTAYRNNFNDFPPTF